LDAAWHVVRQIEALLCGETYWTYEEGIDQFPCFPAVNRPYVERVAGVLEQTHYEPTTGQLTARWQEDGTCRAPTVIYVPHWARLSDATVQITPKGKGPLVVARSPGSINCELHIAPLGRTARREVRISGLAGLSSIPDTTAG
jgi:hypothetical protein